MKLKKRGQSFMDIIEKPILCKACFQKFYPSFYRKVMEREILLCDECLKGVEMLLEEEKFFDSKVLFLSTYQGKIKKWLKYYKEYYDVALAPCFLSPFYLFLKMYSSHYTFVPCPSTKKKNEERGFKALSLILESQGFPVLDCLIKGEEEEQKSKKYLSRFSSQKITLDETVDLSATKGIILFDDVMTTGETFRQSYECLKKCYSKKIKGVILAKNTHKNTL